MSDAVVVALITGGVSLIGTICTVVSSHRRTISALEKQSELSDEHINGEINVIKTEIKALSDRVEKHNQMIERVYSLEKKTAVLDKRMDALEKQAG